KACRPERSFGRGGRSSESYPSARTELPPNKRVPTFIRGKKQYAGRETKAKPRATPVAQPGAAQAATGPTFSPQRVLEGIEELIALVSEKEMTLELLLARAAVPPQKKALFRDGRHAFVRDVRERWFSLFKAILLREEARVIVRKVGLDG